MKFFVLEKRGSRSTSPYFTEFLGMQPLNVGEAPRCTSCGKFLSVLPWVPPYRVSLELWGPGFGDIAFGPGLDILISERMRTFIREYSITGFNGFQAVEVLRVKHRTAVTQTLTPPTYYHVDVIRSQTSVDQIRSQLEWGKGRICPVCREGGDLKRWKSIIIEEGTWPVEDVFFARGLYGTYITSERFKLFCEKHQITNAVFVPAEEYGYDFYPRDNLGRARELAGLPVGGAIREKTKPNGEVWRYDTRTNELVILNPDGSIKTMFRPLDGIEYWKNQ